MTTTGDAPELIRATSDNLEAVSVLFDEYRQFYGKPTDLEKARAYIGQRMDKDESTIFLALLEGRAVGFVQLYPSFCSVEAMPVWILYDLYVAASSRHGGVGKALMNRARQLAVETGASRIDLSTDTGNYNAQGLYEGLGYERDEEFYVYSLAIAQS